MVFDHRWGSAGRILTLHPRARLLDRAIPRSLIARSRGEGRNVSSLGVGAAPARWMGLRRRTSDAVVSRALAALWVLVAVGSLTAIEPEVSQAGSRPVVVVFMENHPASAITPATAPYLSALKNRYRYYSNYHGIRHPSLPNYLAATSGSTQGKTNDSITAYSISGPNIFSQLVGAGIGLRNYADRMPSACSTLVTATVGSGSSKDQYVLKHTPSMMYSNLQGNCRTSNTNPSSLSRFTFVTPSMCNGMHGLKSGFPSNCRTGTTALIRRGDTWLMNHVPAWIAAGAIVFITFDEGSGNLFTVEAGRGIPRSTVGSWSNHYSLLAGLENYYGLPRLGSAVGARNPVRFG